MRADSSPDVVPVDVRPIGPAEPSGGGLTPPTERIESGTELYREVQPLHRNMLIRVLIPVEMVVTVAVVSGVMLSAPAPRPALFAVLIVLGLGLPLWLMNLRLRTTVTSRGLVVRFWPFPGRRVPIEAIESAEAVRYDPLADAGGWGWRISPTYHRAFNVSGDRGVVVVYGPTPRDRFLLGSERAEALAEAIDRARFTSGRQGR